MLRFWQHIVYQIANNAVWTIHMYYKKWIGRTDNPEFSLPQYKRILPRVNCLFNWLLIKYFQLLFFKFIWLMASMLKTFPVTNTAVMAEFFVKVLNIIPRCLFLYELSLIRPLTSKEWFTLNIFRNSNTHWESNMSPPNHCTDVRVTLESEY